MPIAKDESAPVVGFIAPPQWCDPSPSEFQRLTGIESVGVSLDLGDFDWQLERIGETEPLLADAAIARAGPGASTVGIVGTPFGWAGLATGEPPHERNRRIGELAGVDVVSAASAMLDWLREIDARRVALAATYYDRDWLQRWSRFVADSGFAVTNAASMADLGIVSGPLSISDPTHWSPKPDQIEANVLGVLDGAGTDAVIVSGAGARTVTCHHRLRSAAGVPIVAADTALYRGLLASMGSDRCSSLFD